MMPRRFPETRTATQWHTRSSNVLEVNVFGPQSIRRAQLIASAVSAPRACSPARKKVTGWRMVATLEVSASRH